MKRFALLLLLFGFCFWGCDDVVETEIIQIDEEVFILGFISPENDSITVNISKTLPGLGLELTFDNPEADAERFLVRNAIVTIESGSGSSIQLPFMEEQLLYAESTENFEIRPGETYSLTVGIEGKTYTSQCTVPANNIDDIQEVIRIDEDEFGFVDYVLDLSFEDIPNTNNFYFIGGFLDEQDDEFQFQNNLFFDLEAFKTDNIGDGEIITASTSFFPSFSFESEEPVFLEQDLVIQVMNAEQILFDLLRADYLNEINDGDPFIELSVLPNNINGEGGTGVFAGYRYLEKRIPLEEQ